MFIANVLRHSGAIVVVNLSNSNTSIKLRFWGNNWERLTFSSGCPLAEMMMIMNPSQIYLVFQVNRI